MPANFLQIPDVVEIDLPGSEHSVPQEGRALSRLNEMQGYALCPDIFWRIVPGMGRTDTSPSEKGNSGKRLSFTRDCIVMHRRKISPFTGVSTLPIGSRFTRCHGQIFIGGKIRPL